MTIAAGGAISGEHGIGILKEPYIEMELKEQELDLMRSFKRTFDPKGTLNPGKVFTPAPRADIWDSQIPLF